MSDPADGKTYTVILDEASRVEITSASPSVVIIKNAISTHAKNQYSSSEMDVITAQAVDRIAAQGLFL